MPVRRGKTGSASRRNTESHGRRRTRSPEKRGTAGPETINPEDGRMNAERRTDQKRGERAFRPDGRNAAGHTAAWIAAMLLSAALLFSGAAAGEERTMKLMIVTDFHYLSPSLYENSGGFFEKALKNGDGKMPHRSRELLEGLILEVRHQKPDALILSGDLSFNGERESHAELAAAFGQIRAEGTDVWVIPGNHDINYPYAGKYTENGYEHLPGTGPDEFRDIYAASMIRDPSAKGHMSYAVRLNERFRLAMCDVCVYDPAPATGGRYTGETAEWLQGVLEEAERAGARVITVTHQSLIPHTDFMTSAMTIAGGERMARLMRETGNARLNLSGHLHIQHISEDGGIYDIATGAFSVPPFRYGLLTVREDGTTEYEARALCGEHIPPEMSRAAENWFEEIVVSKERPVLEALGIPEGERNAMLRYAAGLNHAYFSGEFVSTDPEWMEDPAYALWMEIREKDPFAGYLTDLPGSPENARSALSLILPGQDEREQPREP